ncbi:MAG: hypothetical protein JOZ57_04365, partial [Abitibacteriaceae bacterium]|nr:hypothetical protein [Abditibacteriaceae bacterium]
MLTALLYNTKTHSLQPLDRDNLLASMPEPEQVEAKQSQHKGDVVTKAPPRCHVDEFMWVDVTDPSEDDLHLICQRFMVHPLVMEDIKAREDRPKLHDYEEYLYVIFHALREVDKAEGAANEEALAQRFGVELSEIDCLVGSDYIVTIHTDTVKPFATLRDRWQQHPELMQSGVGYLLYELMDVVL